MKKYPKSFLRDLYKTMLRIRICEESFVDPILKGEIKCPVHLYTGEEAVATGICANLDHKDYIFGSHRSHGHYLAKGGDMKAMVAEIYGKETGCAKGRGGSMHVVDTKVGMMGAVPIVAGTVSLATGAALASKIRKEKRVAVSFFGDGAVGEGILHESLNLAALKKLPIIFACENNFYSTHMPIREIRPSSKEIHELASPYGIAYARVDGNDVLKVYEAAKGAVALCRTGKGPVFLEFVTYRLRGHVGPDDNIQGSHTDIRPLKEVESWRKKDPLIRMKRLLLSRGFKPADLEKITKAIEKEVDQAHVFARKSPYPKPSELTKYVFSK